MRVSKKIIFLFACVFLSNSPIVGSGLKQVLTPGVLKAVSLGVGDAFTFYAGYKQVSGSSEEDGSSVQKNVANWAAYLGLFFYAAPSGHDVISEWNSLPSDQKGKQSFWWGICYEGGSIVLQGLAFLCFGNAGSDFHSWKNNADSFDSEDSSLASVVLKVIGGVICNTLGHYARGHGAAQLNGTSMKVEAQVSNKFAEKMRKQDGSTMTEQVKNQN